MTIEEANHLLLNERTNISKPGLTRIRCLMQMLGNPDHSLRVIHIVGTNGKSSVTTMLSACLTKSGRKTGTMTSPFVSSPYDYFHIDGALCDQELYKRCVTRVLAEANKMEDMPTEFELSVSTGVCMFAEAGCEVCVLEAGMGGGMDATNLAFSKVLTIVTHISIDHVRFLGSTTKEILTEKLGIVGEGNHCLLGPNTAQVEEESRQIATKDNIKLTCIEDYALEDLPDNYPCGLSGKYQQDNIRTVLAALRLLRELGIRVSSEAVSAGLRSARLPYRFMIAKTDPLLIYDGGHNPDCMRALCGSLRELSETEYVIITGVMKDKDYPAMYTLLAPFATAFYTVTPKNPRALDAAELSCFLTQFGKPTYTCESIENAAKAAITARNEGKNVLITGSLYLMWDIEQAIENSIGGKL